jgi:DNA-binding NarL/FixJ family response regulator
MKGAVMINRGFPGSGDGKKTPSIYLIEAQSLFVPVLTDVFQEAGLELRGVSSDADPRSLLDAQPDIVFIDIDYVAQEPVSLIGVLRTLLPKSAIYVYTSVASWVKERLPGATAVFSKRQDREHIVAGLRDDTLFRSA